MVFKKLVAAIAMTMIAWTSGITSAFADGEFLAKDGQLGFMKPATEVMEDIVWFHDWLLWMCIIISVFVMVLLIYIMIKFRADANPTPSKTTHHTMLEVVWTAVPVLILVVIAIPSFKLLYKQDVIPEADLTVKAIGSQWYWTYEYPDYDDFSFDAVMLTDEEAAAAGKPRLLETDNHVVVPVNKIVRVQTTASDVIHAWTIPAFGAKVDAVPGRLNELWFKAEKEGTFYGQCSELCGVRHGFMPITVRVVSEAEFAAWVEKAKVEFAAAPQANHVNVASAQ